MYEYVRVCVQACTVLSLPSVLFSPFLRPHIVFVVLKQYDVTLYLTVSQFRVGVGIQRD